MVAEEETLNLFARFEANLLEQAIAASSEIPACVVTGFLGSGKTTLVSHILRNRGGLRVGILINEVGAVDIDSRLVDVQQVHAAHRLPVGSELAGGCICCSAAGGLETSLSALRQQVSQQGGTEIDYLVIETSGVADAEPIAASLATHGFRLESVVTVVDAEAGISTLHQPIAQSQVKCADVVVLNKCDLASLSATSAVEDELQRLSPGVRMIRAQFGQAPLRSFMDIEVEEQQQQQQQQQACHTPSAVRQCVHGEVGFLSHEAQLTTPGPTYRVAGRTKRLASIAQHLNAHHKADTASQHQHQHSIEPSHPRQPAAHHHHHHSHLHDGYYSTAAQCKEPIDLAAFQAFAAVLAQTQGLFRAKGILWLREMPDRRCLFHLSGRQRVECTLGDVWSSPPSCQLVLIGNDLQVLEQLRDVFLQLVVGGNQHSLAGYGDCNSPGHLPSISCDVDNNQSISGNGHVEPAHEGTVAMDTAAAAGTVHQSSTQCRTMQHWVAAVLMQQLAQIHERLDVQVTPCQQHSTHHDPSGQSVQDNHEQADTGDSMAAKTCNTPSLLKLSVKGDPLHGIRGSDVNAALSRRLNAIIHQTGHLVLGFPEPPAIHAVSGTSTHSLGERMKCLLMLPDINNPSLLEGTSATNQGSDQRSRLNRLVSQYTQTQCNLAMDGVVGESHGLSQAASKLAQLLSAAMTPTLRKAFPHSGCRCDVAGMAQT